MGVAKLITARCDVSEALINTHNAGGITNAFAVAAGKATKHLKVTDTAADGTVTAAQMGILAQLAADCGHGTPTDAGGNNNSNGTQNDTKLTTSGAWSRFGAVVATAALAA